MSCPRCELRIPLRAPFLTVRHCPRCLATARISVPMLISEDAVGDVPEEISLGQLAIRSQRAPGVLILELRGELDLASAPALQRHVAGALALGSGRVVIDLSRLEFLDSTGLQVLLYAHRKLRENGQALSLRRGPRAIQRLFEVTHTISLFCFEPPPADGPTDGQ
jgi:anti-sigma B factor antagonist